MYTIKTSERNNEKATEFETKSLLYLMTAAPNSENVDLFIIDCFNDVTGVSADTSESWDVQSKGVANLTPKKIGIALYTLFSNYISDIDFSHYLLFLQSFSEEYIHDSTKELFEIDNFKDKCREKIREGLKKEITDRKDQEVIAHGTEAIIDEFLSRVIFVVDKYDNAEYIRRIIYFQSIDKLSTDFLRKIFDEIRAKQASKKISNVYGKTVSSIYEAIGFEKNINRKDVELLVVNRIIGNDLFSKRGIPLYFASQVKDKEPEEIHDLLLDCQAKISYTLFNKNNKKNFWLLLERIMTLLIEKPNSSIKTVFDQISQTIRSNVFTLDEMATLYLIAIVKEGLQRENH